MARGAMSIRRRRPVAAMAMIAMAAIATAIALSLSGGGGQKPRLRPQHASANSGQLSRHAHVLSTPPGTATRHRVQRPARSIAHMLGQMIVVRFPGPQPSASLLARIRAGQVGGVILFADNVTGGLGATKALTAELQRAANEGNQPPLLIMTDQEGGEVKRVPGPPTLAPAAMSSSAVAFAQGQATGRLLRSVGINVDLAPVADVERGANSFLGSRSFGTTPAVVAQRACAFARGLATQHVAYTLKHFPGLGRAGGNTDLGPVTIDAPAGDLRADYQAYQTCGANPLALVMVSSAIYPALSGPLPAVMSPAIYHRELPLATNGARTVTVSDDLEAGAVANQLAPARRAINAGLDMAMYAQTEQASTAAYRTLRQDAKSGALSMTRVQDADRSIASLKRRLAP